MKRWLWGVCLVGGLSLLGCETVRRGAADLRAPEPLSPGDVTSALHLIGTVRGPLRGIGPTLDVETWIRADGSIRADLRYEGQDGDPAHEVLLWTPESALLLDVAEGRWADLSEIPGRVEVHGAQLGFADALWLLTGTRVEGAGTPVEWGRADGLWRGRRGDLNLRRPDTEPPGGADTSWLAPDGVVHTLTVKYSDHAETAWGPVPRSLAIDGSDLSAHVVLKWSLVEVHPAVGDSILDPRWEPGAR